MAMRWQHVVAIGCIALVGCVLGYQDITAQPPPGTIVLYRGTVWGPGYANGGADIDSSGNLRLAGDLTVDGNIPGTIPTGTTDQASLYYNSSGGSWDQNPYFRQNGGVISAGEDDTQLGWLYLYNNGKIRLYNTSTQDTDVDNYELGTDATTGTIYLGTIGGTNGDVKILEIDDSTLEATLTSNWQWSFDGAAVDVGKQSETTGTGSGGMIHLYDDAGGSSDPGFIHFESANGTNWYLFVENDGTVKVSSSVPINNGDGSEVGGQS